MTNGGSSYRPRSISDVFILEMPKEQSSVMLLIHGYVPCTHVKFRPSQRQDWGDSMGAVTRHAFAPANRAAVQADSQHKNLTLREHVSHENESSRRT